MNFHYQAQSYSRPMVNTRFTNRLRRQRVFTWSADKVLFYSIGKILLVLVPVVLAMNLWFASSFNHLVAATQAVDNTHLALMDKQIKLRVVKAQLYSPEQVQLIAAEKFSLHVPGKEQVKFF